LDQVGIMVDMKDLDDDPEDANRLLWLALDAINVTVSATKRPSFLPNDLRHPHSAARSILHMYCV
jgi:hypothetical protein